MPSQEIQDIVQKLLNGEDVSPRELSKDLLTLTAYLYNAGREVTDAERAYAAKWQELRPNYKTDKACDLGIMALSEYDEREKKRSGYKMLIELIRSCKKRLAILQDEAHNAF